jgi:magnesium-transporting ATPase (P-type)
MSKNKEIEMSMKENLIQVSGQFKYDAQQLSDVVILDNHHVDPKNNNMVLSSKMIIEDFGGINEMAKGLKCDLKTGIQTNTIKDRINDFGPNKFSPPHIKSIYELIVENFDDTINKVLFVAAIVSMVIGCIQHEFPGGMLEGTSILIALFIIIAVNSGNNYFSEKRLAQLVLLSDKQDVAVYRDSTEPTTIDASELVVGDLIYFESGMKVPADCIMVEGQNVQTIEGELTGEPDNMDKTPVTKENYGELACSTMMAKSLCCQGFGKALVLAVGTRTVAGVITEKT